MDNLLKGSITELQCCTAFMEAGYEVSIPFGNHARYDLVVDLGTKFIKVQVKTARVKNDYISFDCRNSHCKGHNHVHKQYSADEVDYFATYYNGHCYVVPFDECSTEKRLRFHNPKNDQLKNINFLEDYLLENQF